MHPVWLYCLQYVCLSVFSGLALMCIIVGCSWVGVWDHVRLDGRYVQYNSVVKAVKLPAKWIFCSLDLLKAVVDFIVVLAYFSTATSTLHLAYIRKILDLYAGFYPGTHSVGPGQCNFTCCRFYYSLTLNISMTVTWLPLILVMDHFTEKKILLESNQHHSITWLSWFNQSMM